MSEGIDWKEEYDIDEGSFNDLNTCARASYIRDFFKDELRDLKNREFEEDMDKDSYLFEKMTITEIIDSYNWFISGWFSCIEYMNGKDKLIEFNEELCKYK